MKRLLLLLALVLAPSLAAAQCNGIFPPLSACGSVVGGAPTAIPLSTFGTLTGPGSSTIGDVAIWNNTLGSVLADSGVVHIAGGAATIVGLNGTYTTPTIVNPTLSGTVAGANTIPFSILAQGPGLSFLGITGSGTANVAVITGTANQIPVVNAAGTSLSFVTVSGDLTNATGAFTIANNAVTNAKLAQAGAATLKMNATSGTANSTDTKVSSLTDITTPSGTLDWVPIENHITGTIQKVNPAELLSAAGGGVTNVATGNGLNGGPITATGTISFLGDPGSLTGCILTATTSGNNLTGAVLTQAGATPTTSLPCFVSFRDATSSLPALGGYTYVAVTAATTFVANSGSSFGTANNVPFNLWWVLFNDAGTVRLGAYLATSGTHQFPLQEYTLQSSTACNACAGATAAGTFYTTTAVTTKAMRVFAFSQWASGLAVAGTWASNPTTIQQFTPGTPLPGVVVQRTFGTSTSTNSNSTSGSYTLTDLACSIVPSSKANLIDINANGTIDTAAVGGAGAVAIIRGGSVIGFAVNNFDSAARMQVGVPSVATDAPGSVASLTYTIGTQVTNGAVTITYPASGLAGTGGRITCAEIAG